MTDERFFYVHLQKTAGTSLLLRLRHAFGDEAVYPCDAIDGARDQRTIVIDHLIDRWHERGDDIRVVAGHFPLATAEFLDADFVTFTVLRDPVERTLSFLRHHRVFNTEDRSLSLEEVYDDDFRFDGMIHNHMTKMLSLPASQLQPAGLLTVVDFQPEHLERAKRNLEMIDVVGLQESFEDFCLELSSRYEIDLGPQVETNATKSEPVPQALRDRIAADNSYDVALYAHAVELVERRAASASRSEPLASSRSSHSHHQSPPRPANAIGGN